MTRVGLVVSNENRRVTEQMEAEAREVANENEMNIHVDRHVPTVFNVPFAAQQVIAEGNVDVVVVLGAIVEGDTKRDVVLGHQVTRALLTLGMNAGVPISPGLSGPGMQASEAFDRVDYGRSAMSNAYELM